MRNATRLPDCSGPSGRSEKNIPGGYAASIIDGYQDPLFVIDEAGNLAYCNQVGAVVVRARAGFIVKNGRLHLGSKVADAVLRHIITAAVRDGMAGSCHGVRFPRPGGGRDWFLLVRSLAAPAGVAPASRQFLLHAVARVRPRALSARVLQELFGLTRRETTVVTELLRSGAVRTAACRLSLSTETVRSHLKRAFQKCDVHSQAELFALLQGVAMFACD